MTLALLSLGSNLGDRRGALQVAAARYQPWTVKISHVYESPPWGDPDQPAYLNIALLVSDPESTPRRWLQRAHDAETAAGRVRDPHRRFGPRTLDVDVIAVWGEDGSAIMRSDPDYILPHPRAQLRAFVLRPWAEVQPEAELPGWGLVAQLLSGPELAADLAALSDRGKL